MTFQGPSLVLRNPKRADFALHKVGSLGWKSVYCVYGRGGGEGESVFEPVSEIM